MGHLLGRSLVRLTDLIDRSMSDVRLDAGISRPELFFVETFVEEACLGASMLARKRAIRLTISPVASVLAIDGDRSILLGALSNLLHNALKFTREGGNVSLTTRVTADRVFFDVQDECGGLPPGKIEELFAPYSQRGGDRSGLGLGLSICRKAAKAHQGDVAVRDLPGKGCVFTLELPRKPSRAGYSHGDDRGAPRDVTGVSAPGPAKTRAAGSYVSQLGAPSDDNIRRNRG
jgi:signal transduction histidine kinase